jgi:Glycosyl transferase family 2
MARGRWIIRIVMTLMVRDEADIIDLQIAFHLAAGVDFVIVTDHESRDGTSEILERYVSKGVLHRLPVTSPVKRQAEWVTGMARMAATEFGADWVINSDADEFWWPSGGSLKDVLAQIDDDYGIVQTFVRAFLPRPGEEPFAERMTVRFAPAAPINSPFSPFRVNVRLVHRASADIVVGRGNATLLRSPFARDPGRSPIEVLHFPIRSYRQFEHKFLTHYEASGSRRRGEHVRAYRAARAGRMEELYAEMCVEDEALERGLRDGSLAVDTRLRDAARALASGSAPLSFAPRSTTDEAGYSVDADVLAAGELVRLQRRVDELEESVRRRYRSLRTAT